jgi:hypothetical protein
LLASCITKAPHNDGDDHANLIINLYMRQLHQGPHNLICLLQQPNIMTKNKLSGLLSYILWFRLLLPP